MLVVVVLLTTQSASTVAHGGLHGMHLSTRGGTFEVIARVQSLVVAQQSTNDNLQWCEFTFLPGRSACRYVFLKTRLQRLHT